MTIVSDGAVRTYRIEQAVMERIGGRLGIRREPETFSFEYFWTPEGSSRTYSAFVSDELLMNFSIDVTSIIISSLQRARNGDTGSGNVYDAYNVAVADMSSLRASVFGENEPVTPSINIQTKTFDMRLKATDLVENYFGEQYSIADFMEE